MRFISVFITLLTVASIGFCGVQLSDVQYENIDVIHAEMTKKHSTFRGFNGTKESIVAIGVSDEQVVSDLRKIAIDKINKDKSDTKKNKLDAIKSNMQTVGLSAQTIEYLTGGN